jgi:DNA-binding transcriptional MerR regulator
MRAGLSIGDFSQITHLSVKTLRRYHETGLLQPAEVDPHTGYTEIGWPVFRTSAT